MNLRVGASVLRSGIGPAFLVTAMLAGFACGPAEPPKQASDHGPPDPLTSDSGGNAYAAGRPGTEPAYNPGGNGVVGKTKAGEAPQVPTLGAFMEGLHWGMSHAELQKFMTQTNGVIWKDYDEKLAKARVGPEQTSLEAERENVKAAFGRSYIEFGPTPTGYDSTGISKEYTYNNKEALMWIERKGKKRYYFFIGDKLWKMYDEYPLSDTGTMGLSYQDAVAKLNAQLNATGRFQQPNDKGIDKPQTDWRDGASVLRAIDRSGEKLVGISVADLSTISNLATLRPHKPVDPNELDPSVVAVTKGNRSDPDAANPSPSGSAGKKPAPKKKP